MASLKYFNAFLLDVPGCPFDRKGIRKRRKNKIRFMVGYIFGENRPALKKNQANKYSQFANETGLIDDEKMIRKI